MYFVHFLWSNFTLMWKKLDNKQNENCLTKVSNFIGFEVFEMCARHGEGEGEGEGGASLTASTRLSRKLKAF